MARIRAAQSGSSRLPVGQDRRLDTGMLRRSHRVHATMARHGRWPSSEERRPTRSCASPPAGRLRQCRSPPERHAGRRELLEYRATHASRLLKPEARATAEALKLLAPLEGQHRHVDACNADVPHQVIIEALMAASTGCTAEPSSDKAEEAAGHCRARSSLRLRDRGTDVDHSALRKYDRLQILTAFPNSQLGRPLGVHLVLQGKTRCEVSHLTGPRLRAVGEGAGGETVP